MRYIITHPVRGTYIGSDMGVGIWSATDTSGKTQAITFEDRDQAVDFVRSWSVSGNPDLYGFVPVEADENDMIDIAALIGAGVDKSGPDII